MSSFDDRVKGVLREVVDPELQEIRRLFLPGDKHPDLEEVTRPVMTAVSNLSRIVQDIKTEVKTIETLVNQHQDPQEEEEDQENPVEESPQSDLPTEDEFVDSVDGWYDKHHPDTPQDARNEAKDEMRKTFRKSPKEVIIELFEYFKDTEKEFGKGLSNGAGRAIGNMLVSSILKVVNALTGLGKIPQDTGMWFMTIKPYIDSMVSDLRRTLLGEDKDNDGNPTGEDSPRSIRDVYDRLNAVDSSIDGYFKILGDKLTEYFARTMDVLTNLDDKLTICCSSIKQLIIDEADRMLKDLSNQVTPKDYSVNTTGEVLRRLAILQGSLDDIRGLL